MSSTAFLARQPILDRRGEIVAYELLFRDHERGHGANVEDPTRATVEVLSSVFNELGSRRVLGGKQAFVNLGLEMIESELVELLPADRVVLEILEDVEPSAQLVRRVAELCDAGLRFALDDYVHHRRYLQLLDFVEFVKIDVLAVERQRVERWSRELRQRPLQLLAEKVETAEQHDWALGLGFQLFQGYRFARPETLQYARLDTSSLRVARLMSLVRGEFDTAAVEAVIKHDPALTLKLLTYVNSVRFGLQAKTRSIRQALVVLGQQQLYRWLALMLLQVHGRTPPALAATAVARGRMCELTAERELDRGTCDELFLAGMLSLMPALLGGDDATVLDALELSAPVLEALRSRQGPLGPYLQLAESVESGDPTQVASCAARVGLSADCVNAAHLDAVFWSLDDAA